jgi:transcriptional regulator with XRE-family HTH domain
LFRLDQKTNSSTMTGTRKLPKLLRPSNKAGLAETEHQSINVERLMTVDDRVGLEIRDLRKAQDFTLAKLAAASNLSQGYLSQIERGLSKPSIKVLHSISRALGVTISWFFSSQSPEDDDIKDIVVRAGQRRQLTFNSGIRDELLSPNLGRQIELLRCIFPPGSESGSDSYIHQGEEAGIVVSGELRLWIGEKEVRLKTGDSFAFESDTPHRYDNPSNEETIVIWAITPPSY